MRTLQACLVAGCAIILPVHAAETYNPQIDPAAFSSKITHPLFAMPKGKIMVFEGQTAEGMERETVEITGETKVIMGVETLAYFDTSTIDGTVAEVTKDYLAQDTHGNVWYFGEEVDNFENGKLKDHHGTWLAGVKGAKPGIWMQAKPAMGRVISTNDTVKVKAGAFTGCTKTLDWTPLEPDKMELKYFCPGVASQVLTENLATGERFELASVASGG
jgi:hypothetical protein